MLNKYFTETSKFWVILNRYGYDINFTSWRYWFPWRYCYDLNLISPLHHYSLSLRHRSGIYLNQCLVDIVMTTIIFKKNQNLFAISIWYRRCIAINYRWDITAVFYSKKMSNWHRLDIITMTIILYFYIFMISVTRVLVSCYTLRWYFFKAKQSRFLYQIHAKND